MKRFLFILFALHIAFISNGQIFGPKKLKDIKEYPNGKSKYYDYIVPKDKELIIIDQQEINIPIVLKVFPGASFIDITYQGSGMYGNYTAHKYYMKFKGIYYSSDYLNVLEKETNDNGFSNATLEERISAFATIAWYSKLLIELHVDSLEQISQNPDGKSYVKNKFTFNNGSFNGGSEIYYNVIGSMYLYNLNLGVSLFIPEGNSKSINMNIINTDSPVQMGLKRHYYFKANSTTTNARIEISGLDPSQPAIIKFRHWSNDIDIRTDNLIFNGSIANYYYNSTLETGVYRIRIMQNGVVIEDFNNDFFIPEDRLEGDLTPGLSSFMVHSTKMFYNSVPSLFSEIDYDDFISLVSNVLSNSYNTYNNLDLIPSTGIIDFDDLIDIYILDFLESGFPYHGIILNHDDEAMCTRYFSNNDDCIIIDYNFKEKLNNVIHLSYDPSYSITRSVDHSIKTGVSHEFFHIVQKNINTNIVFTNNIDWLKEGTARFIQTIFLENNYPSDLTAEFQYGSLYYLDSKTYLTKRLYPTSPSTKGQLDNISYDYCLYWRFLYEQFFSVTADAAQSLITMKNALVSAPSNNYLNSIKVQMDAAFTNSPSGLFNNFQHSLTNFAKSVSLIQYNIGQWINNSTYPAPNIVQKSYIGQYFSDDAITSAAFGITIHEIPLYGHGAFTVTFNKNTFWGNCSYSIYVYATNSSHTEIYLPSLPLSPIIQFNGSNSTTCTFNYLPSDCKLFLAFVQTRLSDAGSSVNYEIVNEDNNINMVADFSPKYINITPGTTVVFQDASSYSSYYDYNWTFTGGVPATASTPTVSVRYDYEGIYPVKLTINHGNHVSIKNVSQCVNVSYSAVDAPVADFSYSVSNNTVTFQDASTNSPTNWFWDFGDGNTILGQPTPFHTYSNPGNASYTVTMTASNASGFSSTVKTINFSSQGIISITGRVTLNNQPTAGIPVNVYTTYPHVPSYTAYTNSNGNYTLTLDNNFSGTICPEYIGHTCAPAVFTDLQYSISGLNFGMFPVEMTISSQQLYGTYYRFTLENAPIGTVSYRWIITGGPNGTELDEISPLRIENHFFTCQTNDVNYYISVIAEDDMGRYYSSPQLELPIYSCGNATAYSYIQNNCPVIRKEECLYLKDASSPFSEISRVVVWFGDGSPIQTWLTDNIPGPYDPNSYMYRANCREFIHCFSSQGLYQTLLEIYDLNGFSNGSSEIDIAVVDCDLTSANFVNSVSASFFTGTYNYYSGTHNISSLANIPNYPNKNVNVKACNEIILEGDFYIAPNHGYELNLEIDLCLYREPFKSEIQEEPSQEPISETIEFQKQTQIITGDFGVSVYPNPNEGRFAVETKNSDINSIQIYNSVGQLLQSFDNVGNTLYLMDISSQPKGVYYLKVQSTKSVQTFKIINSVIL